MMNIKVNYKVRIAAGVTALLTLLSPSIAFSDVGNNHKYNQSDSPIELHYLGRYSTGLFKQMAAEISAYDPRTQRLFVTNAAEQSVDVLDITQPAQPKKIHSIDIRPLGALANSVAIHKGLVAVAIAANVKQDNGLVGFFDANSFALLAKYRVGALPDMLAFTPDGQKLLVANEGEPNEAYTVDPEGSISIIDLSLGVPKARIQHVNFSDFNGKKQALNDEGVRIFGPKATVAQDLEPEYLTISADSKTAWVSLQENNALLILDIPSATIRDLTSWGTKDYSLYDEAMDVSDKDGRINIAPWPVQGMYQPDTITNTVIDGTTYLFTANEGEIRDYAGYTEEVRVKKLPLNRRAYGEDVSKLQSNAALGRLKVSLEYGHNRLNIFDMDNADTEPQDNTLKYSDLEGSALEDGALEYSTLYSFGTRSFAIWSAKGRLIWDSGSDFERIIAELYPDHFNANHKSNGMDKRSDDKGVEPEAIAVFEFQNRVLAFIGLERFGGIMVYDVTNPRNPTFLTYQLDRNFEVDPEEDLLAAGDLGPESILIVPGNESPIDEPLVIVANEVSGTVTLYSLRQK